MQRKTRRDMILDAMQELMNEPSGNAISISDTARKAGVGKESICYYFPSRNDTMEAMIECSYFMVIEKSKELATITNISAFKKMEVIFRTYTEASSELKRRGEYNNFMELQQSAPTHQKSISFLIKNLKPILSNIILQEMEGESLTYEYSQEIAEITLIILTVRLDNHLSPASTEEIQDLLRASSWMQTKNMEITPGNLEFPRIQTDIRQSE